MLDEQLRKQIEQEADVITARMDDCEAGKIKGFEEEYIKAGERYAEKMQRAEAHAERYEKALKEIIALRRPLNDDTAVLIALQALTPKTSNDDKVNG